VVLQIQASKVEYITAEYYCPQSIRLSLQTSSCLPCACIFVDTCCLLQLQPNGRFEVGAKICLSISAHHPEYWQPSWSSEYTKCQAALPSTKPLPSPNSVNSFDWVYAKCWWRSCGSPWLSRRGTKRTGEAFALMELPEVWLVQRNCTPECVCLSRTATRDENEREVGSGGRTFSDICRRSRSQA